MDSPEQPPSKKPARFFDIVPANKTKPDTSSRPIVVTNQPEQKDPMVTVHEQPAPTDKPKAASVSEPSSITVAEALDSASEPIKLDEPSQAESAQTPAPVIEEPTTPPEETSTEKDGDKTAKVPDKPSADVVIGQGGRAHPIRDAIIVLLILVMIVVIADLLLDLNIVKFALPHTHYFGG